MKIPQTLISHDEIFRRICEDESTRKVAKDAGVKAHDIRKVIRLKFREMNWKNLSQYAISALQYAGFSNAEQAVQALKDGSYIPRKGRQCGKKVEKEIYEFAGLPLPVLKLVNTNLPVKCPCCGHEFKSVK